MKPVALLPVDVQNWEVCARITPKPEQSIFQVSAPWILLQAHYNALKVWAICSSDIPVGLISWGNWGGYDWVARLLVDAAWQNQGIGRKALQLLEEEIPLRMRGGELRTAIHPENYAAEYLFRSAGFCLKGTFPDGERILGKEW
ncbi:MAG: GNAT family N-acetyltransferase [Sphingobacteriia bacterium]|nr:GNAT family N-acetyltransferase [Sphingobacteriia bacterium]